jgi:hypothetical protein
MMRSMAGAIESSRPQPEGLFFLGKIQGFQSYPQVCGPQKKINALPQQPLQVNKKSQIINS